jgi:hypothetical protein
MVDVNNDREPGSEGQTIDNDHPLAISPARISQTLSHSHKSPNLPTEKFDLWGLPQTPLFVIDVPRECCTRF